MELGKSLIGKSDYTFAGLYFFALLATGGFISPSRKDMYIKKGNDIRKKMLEMLGDNGVLFYPTFNEPAIKHCESYSKISGVMYSMFINIMGFPSTHVPVRHNFLYFSFFFLINFPET